MRFFAGLAEGFSGTTERTSRFSSRPCPSWVLALSFWMLTLMGTLNFLTNTTAAQGNCLSVRLVGTSGSRDAVCSNVRVQIGNVVQTQQVSAGDGYQCSNEKLLIFGCGQPGIADLLTVRWSSGAEQVFSSVPLPARLIVVEGRSVTYACPR